MKLHKIKVRDIKHDINRQLELLYKIFQLTILLKLKLFFSYVWFFLQNKNNALHINIRVKVVEIEILKENNREIKRMSVFKDLKIQHIVTGNNVMLSSLEIFNDIHGALLKNSFTKDSTKVSIFTFAKRIYHHMNETCAMVEASFLHPCRIELQQLEIKCINIKNASIFSWEPELNNMYYHYCSKCETFLNLLKVKRVCT